MAYSTEIEQCIKSYPGLGNLRHIVTSKQERGIVRTVVLVEKLRSSLDQLGGLADDALGRDFVGQLVRDLRMLEEKLGSVGSAEKDLFPCWLAVPALLCYMDYFYGSPNWDAISKWFDEHLKGGRAVIPERWDARDWWRRACPKGNGGKEGWDIRNDAHVLAFEGARLFLSFAWTHYTEQHMPAIKVKALFKEWWRRQYPRKRYSSLRFVRQKSCANPAHEDPRKPTKVVRKWLPDIPHEFENELGTLKATETRCQDKFCRLQVMNNSGDTPAGH